MAGKSAKGSAALSAQTEQNNCSFYLVLKSTLSIPFSRFFFLMTPYERGLANKTLADKFCTPYV
jgi:hypothetical protein